MNHIANVLHNQRARNLDADGTALLPVCVNDAIDTVKGLLTQRAVCLL